MTTSCLPRAFRFLAIAVLALTALGLRAASPATFDIPAQPAPAALKQFIKQSGTQVVYIQDDLKSVTTKAVKGELAPAAALAQLLEDTGFAVETMVNGNFTISRQVAEKSGSIEGTIRDNESSRPVAGARVAIAGTEVSVVTDKRGRFVFADAPVGDYTLEINAEGILNTKVTDVSVKAGHRLTLSTINVPVKAAGAIELEPYVVSAKKNDGVIELDPYEVSGTRTKPFTGANVDIPRTTNDAQPYYIYDAKTIDTSGASNIEAFLRQRLTMNTAATSNAANDTETALGNTSSFNLRGLGTDKTLVLINGRRVAGLQSQGNSYQPDLNAIPLGAIERIEVLPSSASGIYGGGAIGGVINVILKQNYTGGEVRTTYENTWNTDSPIRAAYISYGFSLEGGRTRLMLSAHASDAEPLLQQDRKALFDRGISRILQNSPTVLFSPLNPFLGATTNITRSSAGNLVLDNGTSIGTRITSIPAGTSPTTSTAALYSGLISNAGTYNLTLPATVQTPTGLLRPFGYTPKEWSLAASLRRQLTSRIDLFADFSRNTNQASFLYSPVSALFVVSALAPTNPFDSSVRVKFPTNLAVRHESNSITDRASLGFTAQLPWDWTAELDYSWSKTHLETTAFNLDSTAVSADLNSGALNPFVDMLLYPPDMLKYIAPSSYAVDSILRDVALRGSGPLFALPWGKPSLTFGLEHRWSEVPQNSATTTFPISTTRSSRTTYFPRQQTTASGYAELELPLAPRRRFAWLNALALQLSGRSEKYTVDTGTQYMVDSFNLGSVFYATPTVNGAPIYSRASYTSTNSTIGLKYEPVEELTLRASFATAFLPPTPSQLIKNAEPDLFDSIIIDPRDGSSYFVQTLSGGNPSLKPQHSKSLNAGLIWQPHAVLLRGLRFNLEYYRIEQFDKILSLPAQSIVNGGIRYADRVTRDSSGLITRVDRSLLNLFKNETAGWDLSVDFQRKTDFGTVTLNAVGTLIAHERRQELEVASEVDYAGYPAEGGPAKRKANLTLAWENGGWTGGWSVRYFDSYHQQGAVGGPFSTLYADGNVYGTRVAAQGASTIPSQTYHDIFAGYVFAREKSPAQSHRWGAGLLHDLGIQVGVKNAFNKVPPFDAFYQYYTSPYGDKRLRSYWVSVRKQF
jgi:iron complex outermembrane recepter protein